MKNIFQRYIILFAMFFCLINLSGCGKSSDLAATDMVILIGNHANSAKITWSKEIAVEKVYTSFGNIAIIAVDGNPTIARDSSDNIIGSYAVEQNEQFRRDCEKNRKYWEKNSLKPRTDNIINEIDTISADSPEVDLIMSLFEAIKAFGAIQSSDENVKEIIIIDTGLSTSGPLSFLDDDLFALVQLGRKLSPEEVAQVISDLDAKASLPNLNGIAVTWYGLGSVCTPQPELTQLERYNLRVIWGEILKASNAHKSPYQNTDDEYGIFVETLEEGQIECDYTVTAITPAISKGNNDERNDDNGDSQDVNSKESIILEPPDKDKIEEISEKELEFKKNTSEYFDNKLALDVLEGYAEKLLLYPDLNILLVGTVSDPHRNGGDVRLSQERAETVKRSFVELGIAESRITACGIGATKYLTDLYNQDEWNGNDYIESEAAKNRAVHIIPMDLELARKILAVVQQEGDDK